MKFFKMIEIYLKYDNMHTFGVIDTFIYINNHINSCINSMLSGLRVGLQLSQWDERRLSLIRVRLLLLLTVVLWRIGLIVFPPKSYIMRRIIKNRSIIIVRVCTRKIWSPLLSWSS